MADAVVLVMGIYAVVGAAFAIAFVSRGVGTIDEQATAAPLGFRLMILPGAAALWPLLLFRWLRVGVRAR